MEISQSSFASRDDRATQRVPKQVRTASGETIDVPEEHLDVWIQYNCVKIPDPLLFAKVLAMYMDLNLEIEERELEFLQYYIKRGHVFSPGKIYLGMEFKFFPILKFIKPEIFDSIKVELTRMRPGENWTWLEKPHDSDFTHSIELYDLVKGSYRTDEDPVALPPGCSLIPSCDIASSVEFLKYARLMGCPWDEKTAAAFALRGNLECLKYAHENGCPWDSNVIHCAKLRNHEDCLWYANANGCPSP